jgi:hypothetical protein
MLVSNRRRNIRRDYKKKPREESRGLNYSVPMLLASYFDQLYHFTCTALDNPCQAGAAVVVMPKESDGIGGWGSPG